MRFHYSLIGKVLILIPLVDDGVRCLVKMQKRGQNNCPACRQPVVLRANACSSPFFPPFLSLLMWVTGYEYSNSTANLDKSVEAYLQLWFPREVKEKKRLNEIEASKEQLEEAGINGRCSVQ